MAGGLLTRDDADLITGFVTELQASQGITTIRVNKIASHLINWRRYICPYREATIGDILSAIATVKEVRNQRDRPFKQNTLHDYSTFLKRLYLWMIGNDYSDLPKAKILKIKPPRVDRYTKIPDQMLSQEEGAKHSCGPAGPPVTGRSSHSSTGQGAVSGNSVA